MLARRHRQQRLPLGDESSVTEESVDLGGEVAAAVALRMHVSHQGPQVYLGAPDVAFVDQAEGQLGVMMAKVAQGLAAGRLSAESNSAHASATFRPEFKPTLLAGETRTL